MRDLDVNMSGIFDKLNDLKNLFKFGERIVPIIQSLIEFMKEIVPLLENINSSIMDSANKMPQASSQISNVTNATELATTEILDLVDKITLVVTDVEDTLKTFRTQHSKKEEIIVLLKKHLKGNQKALELLEEFAELDKNETVIKNTLEKLDGVKADTYQITLSLQVQDITAQQLAAVNHLIESVHEMLANLISDINESEIKDDFKSLDLTTPEGLSFDPNASYDKDESRQKNVDKIVDNKNKNKKNEQTSQDEIDKLFS